MWRTVAERAPGERLKAFNSIPYLLLYQFSAALKPLKEVAMKRAGKSGFGLRMIEEARESTVRISSRSRHLPASYSDSDDEESVDEEAVCDSNPFATAVGSLWQVDEDFSDAENIIAGDSVRENTRPAAAGTRSAEESLIGGRFESSESRSEIFDIRHNGSGRIAGKEGGQKLQRSLSNDSFREEAWIRRKLQFDVEERKGRTIGRSASDCGDTAQRTRILTDADLQELKGCIDLGFCFNCNEDRRLCSTFPALDLYYAVNRQYNDCISKSSPVSTHGSSFGRSSSSGSPPSPFSDAWTISSPGDSSQDVKTRLRHWAQAVACSVRHSCS